MDIVYEAIIFRLYEQAVKSADPKNREIKAVSPIMCTSGMKNGMRNTSLR